jgi:hypothetical protein
MKNLIFRFSRKWHLKSFFLFSMLCLSVINNEIKAQITIDGNPSDWGVWLAASGGVKARIIDPINNTDNIWDQGSKDVQNVSQWNWKAGGANDKDNIQNAGFTVINNTVYFFGDRHDNSGDASIGFWLLQTPVKQLPDHSFSGVHADGDILIVSHFVNGGGIDEIKAFKWIGSSPGALDPTPLPLSPTTLFASGNDLSYPSPWLYTPKSGPDNIYAQHTFFEGCINLDDVGVSLDVCLGTFIVQTRNSQSLNAALEDLVIGGLSEPVTEQTLTGSSICSNQSNTGTIIMAGSEPGVIYQLKFSDNSNVGAPVTGNGNSITWTGLAAGTYHITATNAAGCTTDFGNVTVTLIPVPDCSITGPDHVCPGSSNTYNGPENEGSFSWSITGNGSIIPPSDQQTVKVKAGSICGSYTLTLTRSNNGCTVTCSKTFTVFDQTRPNITNNPPTQIAVACGTTFNNLPWQPPVWADNCGGTITVTSVISPDQQQNTCPATYTRTWTATDACNNTATFSQAITVACCTICTYTQGYYGNAGGLSCNGTIGNLTTKQQIVNSINSWGGTLTVGLPGHSVFISNATPGYLSCVIDKLPGGGPPKELAAFNYDICNLPGSYLKNGRIHNILLAQTITLGINMRIMQAPNLSALILQGGSLATAGLVGGCGGNVPVQRVCLYDPITHLLIGVQNDYKYFTIDPAVVNALDPIPANRTVGALFNLANKALANQDGIAGSENGVSLTAISNVVDAINNAFDGCRTPVGYNVSPCQPSFNSPVTNDTYTISILFSGSRPIYNNSDLPKVNAFPNPYYDQVKFVFNAPESGQGTLEIYNLLKQKLQTVSTGYLIKGVDQVFLYNVPPEYRNNLIYKFSVADKTVSGLLINGTVK